jgi:hypothetical protein
VKFDNEQEKLLQPLLSDGAIVHFPFFANTFPLAFHYFQLGSNESDKVRLHKWGEEEIPADVILALSDSNEKESHPHVFYATRKTVKVLEDILKGQSTYRLLEPQFFTEYKPERFFLHTERHVFLRSLVREHCKNRQVTRQFADSLRSEFAVIEIFTDIPRQADLVKDLLSQHGFNAKHIVVIDSWDDVFSREAYTEEALKKKVLRIYFYGAPVSNALKKREEEFTYLKVPITETTDKSELYTYICVLVPNKDYEENENDNSNGLMRGLAQYHRNLFHAANTRCSDLRNIWWTYNRFALWQQHNSVFDNPKDYADCLLEHHSTEAP